MIQFDKFIDLRSISSTFSIDFDLLSEILKSQTREEFYEKMFIPKLNKRYLNEYRVVYNAKKQDLKLFHKNVLSELQKLESNYVSEFAYGFIRGKSTFDNANQHLNKKIIIRFDIKDFFDSIDIKYVIHMFKKIGANDKIATMFSKFITIDDKLAEGLHTSPIVSNIVFYDLDLDINKLAKEYNCKYTRYADDLTFSTDNITNENINSLKNKLVNVLSKLDLVLNDNKTLVSRYGKAQYVNGLSVSNNISPQIPRKMKKNIRQKLYYIKKYGIDNHCKYIDIDMQLELNKLNGLIAYTKAINRYLGDSFYKQALKIGCFEPIYNYNKRLFRKIEKTNNIYFYFDESEYEQYFAMSCVLIECSNYDYIKNNLLEKYNEIKGDQLILRSGRLFHYCEDNVDVREKVIDTLRKNSFQAYIAYTKRDNNKEYSDYLELFKRLLFDRVVKNHNFNIFVFYEENNKVKYNDILNIVSNITELIYDKNCKNNITIKQVAKEDDILIVIPDYVLGIFKDAILKENSKNFEIQNFKKLKTKIRLILDIDDKQYYSRYLNMNKG